MKTDPRVQKNGESIVALALWLEEIAQQPGQFAENDELKHSLLSQGGVCRLRCPERGVHGCSLNTLKRIAPHVLDGGFSEFEDLRRRALQAIKEHLDKLRPVGTRSQRKDLTTRAAEAAQELQIALQDSWLLTVALQKALQQGRYYASQTKNPTVIALCEREQRELRAMFSLRRCSVKFKADL